MAARMSMEDQFKFLISCVRHSVNGKVDFAAVALECGVVSKGAAAKRYERMLKSHDIDPHGGFSDRPVSPTKKRPSTAKVSKKRKLDESPGIKHDMNEDRKPSMVKRKKVNEQQQVKQESMPITYPPYMYQPIMTGQTLYMPRPYMPSNAPYPTAFPPQIAPPPFQMMMANQHNRQFQLPFRPFQQPAEVPPPIQPVQEFGNLAVTDSADDKNLEDESFEAMLYSEPIDQWMHNTTPRNDGILQQLHQHNTNTSTEPELQLDHVKAEPESAACDHMLDPNLGCHVCDVPQQGVVSTLAEETHSIAPVGLSDSNGNMTTTQEGNHEIATTQAETEPVQPIKTETDGCIFISD